MNSNKSPRALTLCLLGVILVVHLVQLVSTTFIDWPEIILFPWFIKEGLRLYSQIITVHSPGSILISYIYFSIFGFSHEAYRLWAYFVILISDCLLFYVCLKFWGKKVIAVAILLIYSCIQVCLEGNGIWQESYFLPFILLLVLCLRTYLNKRSWRSLVGASVCLGVSVFIKQNALYPLLASLAYIGIVERAYPTRIIKGFLILLSLPIVISLASYLFFVYQGQGREFLTWVVAYPFLLGNPKYLYASYPTVKVSVVLAGIYSVTPISLLLLFSKKVTKEQKNLILLTALICVSLIAAGLPRWEEFRMQASLPFTILALGFIFVHLSRKAYFAALIPFSLMVLYLARRFYFIDNARTHQFMVQKNIETAKQIDERVQGHPVYFAKNYEYYYYLLGKKPEVLPWTQHFPWLIKANNLGQNVIKRLNDAKVEYIVISAHDVPDEVYVFVMSNYSHTFTLDNGAWIMKRSFE